MKLAFQDGRTIRGRGLRKYLDNLMFMIQSAPISREDKVWFKIEWSVATDQAGASTANRFLDENINDTDAPPAYRAWSAAIRAFSVEDIGWARSLIDSVIESPAASDEWRAASQVMLGGAYAASRDFATARPIVWDCVQRGWGNDVTQRVAVMTLFAMDRAVHGDAADDLLVAIRDDPALSVSGRTTASFLLAERYAQCGDPVTARSIKADIMRQPEIPQWFLSEQTRQNAADRTWNAVRQYGG